MTVIAIDGPAAAGKSTVARAVALALGYEYLDTGAMYRAVALAALENDVDPQDGHGLGELARSLKIAATPGRATIDGRDVTARIRDSDVTELVPAISARPEVREALVALQRDAAATADVVMEGRDIGSAAVPDAEIKVFLTASPDERARRRVRQLGAAEDSDTLESYRLSIEARDASDSNRTLSPLVQPEDAFVIDSTGRPIDEVVDEIVSLARGRDAGSQAR
ncbi:MAG: (d)CMP kinase [Actinomycetota bacterium]